MRKEEYLAQHGARKEKLLALLDDAQKFMVVQEKPEDAAALQKLGQNIEEGLFSIVLIGAFSAGKSTFLNALMHKRILPSYTRETTAAVNFLRHASKAPHGEPGIVYYRDGSTEVLPDLSVDTLTQYVTVGTGTERNHVPETTERVDLFLESRFLEDGVMLIDSPGLNGITENLESITRQQIKESHASIFMFSAGQPGSKTDFEILRDLRAQCGRIFIVLNKIDDIKSGEKETVEGVVAHLKESYAEQFAGAPLPEIYPISSYQALLARDPEGLGQAGTDAAERARLEEGSRLPAFEDRLFRYLVEGEKAQEAFSAPVHTLRAMLGSMCSELDARIEVLCAERSPDELIAQQGAIEDKIGELRQEREALWQPLRIRFQSVMRDIYDRMSGYSAGFVERVVSEAELIEDVEDLREYAAGLEDRITGEHRRRLQRMDDELREELAMVADEISGQALEGLSEAVSSIPGAALGLSARTFQMTEMEVGSRLEADEKAFAEKRREMQALEDEMQRKEMDKIAARRMERRRDEIKQEQRELAQRYMNIEDSFTIPAVDRYEVPVIGVRDRRGFFGKIGNFLFGGREYQTVEVKTDSSARDEALRLRDGRLDGIAAERAQLQKEMREYQEPAVGSEELDYEIKAAHQRMQRLQKEYKDALQKHTERIEKEAARAMKGMRREIRRYAEERGEEFERAARSGLQAVKQKSYEAVRGMVTVRIEDEIRRCEERLARLIADSEASDAERDQKLQLAQEARAEADALIARSEAFAREIADKMQDVIEEV